MDECLGNMYYYYDMTVKSPLLQHLEHSHLLVDGAMGSFVQTMDLSIENDYLGRENCTEMLVRTRPDDVQRIHESFLAVGADAVETNTFGANRLVFAEFDEELTHWSYDINKSAAEIARAACDAHATPDQPRFVLGSMGPGTKLVSLGHTTWDDMLDSYREQVRGLIDGGVDALIIETAQDLLQVKCAINACLAAMEDCGKSPEQIPIMVSLTIETTGTMLLGTEISAAVNALRMFPIASIGLNCATGPVEMTQHIAWLSKHWDRAISVIPNAGLPVLRDGKTHYPLGPDAFAQSLARFIDEYGINILGGCCGTTTEHIAQLAPLVKDRKLTQRTLELPAPSCSSLYHTVEYVQDNSFLIIAERTNANGSRKFKRLLDEEDWDGLVGMAREELKGGSHLLDVCVDFVGRDGVADITEVVSRYVRQINAPLMIDSTEAPVLEAALKLAGGKCIVNSINLEDGEHRLDEVCPLLKTYGSACVALTIDEDPEAGMAKTADRKLAIAQRIHKLYTQKWGLDENDLLIDPLTFTIATGNEADRKLGLETLEGIRLIHEHLPKCGILLGLSNISFGLRPPARAVLNSVFLHEARERGLTAAIVHASKILPRNKIADEQWEAAQWLIFDQRGENRPEGQPEDFDPLLYFIGLFPEGDEQQEVIDHDSLTLEEKLQRHIIDGDDSNLSDNLDEALQTYSPVEIINDHLLAGMKVVGELFGSGQMQLPFVLQSAEVMKKAVAHLEPHMETVGDSVQSKAKIVLATVAGDVHDIGKNLVDIILSNNGYEVSNIGIKQPISQILESARETNADAIGMSGLLVKSVGVMETNLHELNTQEIEIPVLLGGAALTRHYAESHLREIYEGPLYYGRDAFEALHICDHLAEGQLRTIDSEVDRRVARRAATAEKVAALEAESKDKPSAESEDGSVAVLEAAPLEQVDVPQPPFWGAQMIESLSLTDIFAYINTTALFRGQWQFRKRNRSEEEYQELMNDVVLPIFDRLKQQCIDEEILRPQVVYGYFPCASDGDDLLIFDPDDHDREIERFSFPRQTKRQRRCISDFFRSIGDSQRDVIGMHCVTMGQHATERTQELFESNQYAEYLYLHGISVESAEALAELWHKQMRMELGIATDDAPTVRDLFVQRYRGSRYSFGYPACPEMSDQEKLFRLLEPERIGCTLTDNWQIDPEQSTSAIIVHHPEAKYFNV